jgi:hypothetical protein
MGNFLGGFFVLFCAGFFVLFLSVLVPLWWENDRTTSETQSPGLEAEGWTPKLLRQILLHLHLKIFKYFFLVSLIFLFSFFLFFSFYFQSSLCLSNACSAYCWLVHYLSLFIFLKHFLLFCCLFFLLVSLFFPISLTSLLSISSHPSILNTTIVITTS